MAYTHSKDFVASVQHVEGTAGPAAAAHLSYRAAKGIYEQFATRKKLPWFNDLHPVRAVLAWRRRADVLWERQVGAGYG